MNAKASKNSFHSLVNDVDFWLKAIATCLAAIFLTLTWRIDDTDLLASALLFLAAVISLLNDRWKTLNSQSSLFSVIIGSLILGFLLVRSTTTPSVSFLLGFPLLAAFALALLASGFKGIHQYKKELGILLFLALPRLTLPLLIDPTLWTAKFSATALWYLGFPVVRDGLNIQINAGIVEVYPGCSGIDSMIHLLSLSGLYILMFASGWLQKVLVAIASLIIAFIVNGFRVALMAYLVSISNSDAFDYWHEGDGSLIFSVIAVLIFGSLCFILMRQGESVEHPFLDADEQWDDMEG